MIIELVAPILLSCACVVFIISKIFELHWTSKARTIDSVHQEEKKVMYIALDERMKAISNLEAIIKNAAEENRKLKEANKNLLTAVQAKGAHHNPIC